MKDNNHISFGSIIEYIVRILEEEDCAALYSNMDDSICVAEASEIVHSKFREFTLTTNILLCPELNTETQTSELRTESSEL